MAGVMVEQVIREKLTAGFAPLFFDLVNESHMHNVPENSETHFKVVLVSASFAGMRAVKRHQTVYAALREELAGPVHALALHTYTPEEWADISSAPDSPECLGGSKVG